MRNNVPYYSVEEREGNIIVFTAPAAVSESDSFTNESFNFNKINSCKRIQWHSILFADNR